MIALIKSLPQLLALASAIMSFVKKEVDAERKQAILKTITEKVKEAHGSTSSIEDLFGPKP